MIIMITGVPGSFKTLLAMKLLTEPDYSNRPVYSNIDGAGHLPIPDDDWRNTPEGSLVIYDEAQSFFPSSGRAGNSTDPRIVALDQHRHTGHDLIFITQRYTLIHHHIRGFVGRHLHLVRKTKSIATLYTNGEAFNPDDKKMIKTVTASVFHAPTDLFDKYKSSSLHTKVQTGLKIPLWVWIAVASVAAAGFLVYHTFNGFMHSAGSTAVESVKAISSTQSTVSTPVSSSLAGCISTSNSCLCYSNSGEPLNQSYTECRHFITSHRYISLAASDSSSRISAPPSTSAQSKPDSPQDSQSSTPTTPHNYSSSTQLQPNWE